MNKFEKCVVALLAAILVVCTGLLGAGLYVIANGISMDVELVEGE